MRIAFWASILVPLAWGSPHFPQEPVELDQDAPAEASTQIEFITIPQENPHSPIDPEVVPDYGDGYGGAMSSDLVRGEEGGAIMENSVEMSPSVVSVRSNSAPLRTGNSSVLRDDTCYSHWWYSNRYCHGDKKCCSHNRSGNLCCPSAYPNCCNGGRDGCCPISYPICCGGRKCCSAAYPVCCCAGRGCCPEGTHCCGTNHCCAGENRAVKCGVEMSASQRIVNGVDVSVIRKYSWQAGISDSATPVYYCGGSIITDTHILTAAHCFYVFPDDDSPCYVNIPSEFYVGVGDHAQEDTSDNLPNFNTIIRGQTVQIHESFDCNTLANDIAVIVLSQPIGLMKAGCVIHPICLPKDDSKNYAEVTATISGWGSTVGYNLGEDKTPNYPNILQEAQLTVKHNTDCGIQDSQLCAGTEEGYENGGKDTCQGDSGGPIYVKESNQHVQIGVVSYGWGCASQGYAGVYARVTYYLDWIKGKVGTETLYTRD